MQDLSRNCFRLAISLKDLLIFLFLCPRDSPPGSGVSSSASVRVWTANIARQGLV